MVAILEVLRDRSEVYDTASSKSTERSCDLAQHTASEEQRCNLSVLRLQTLKRMYELVFLTLHF